MNYLNLNILDGKAEYKHNIRPASRNTYTNNCFPGLSFDSGKRGRARERERFPGVVKAGVSISAEATSHFALRARARGLL